MTFWFINTRHVRWLKVQRSTVHGRSILASHQLPSTPPRWMKRAYKSRTHATVGTVSLTNLKLLGRQQIWSDDFVRGWLCDLSRKKKHNLWTMLMQVWTMKWLILCHDISRSIEIRDEVSVRDRFIRRLVPRRWHGNIRSWILLTRHTTVLLAARLITCCC